MNINVERCKVEVDNVKVLEGYFNIDYDKKFDDSVVRLFGYLFKIQDIIHKFKRKYNQDVINALFKYTFEKNFKEELIIEDTKKYKVYLAKSEWSSRLIISFKDGVGAYMDFRYTYTAEKLFNEIYGHRLVIKDVDGYMIDINSDNGNIQIKDLENIENKSSINEIIRELNGSLYSIRMLLIHNDKSIEYKYGVAESFKFNIDKLSNEDEINNYIIGKNNCRINIHDLCKNLIILGHKNSGEVRLEYTYKDLYPTAISINDNKNNEVEVTVYIGRYFW